jgi:hypothetical protein
MRKAKQKWNVNLDLDRLSLGERRCLSWCRFIRGWFRKHNRLESNHDNTDFIIIFPQFLSTYFRWLAERHSLALTARWLSSTSTSTSTSLWSTSSALWNLNGWVLINRSSVELRRVFGSPMHRTFSQGVEHSATDDFLAVKSEKSGRDIAIIWRICGSRNTSRPRTVNEKWFQKPGISVNCGLKKQHLAHGTADTFHEFVATNNQILLKWSREGVRQGALACQMLSRNVIIIQFLQYHRPVGAWLSRDKRSNNKTGPVQRYLNPCYRTVRNIMLFRVRSFLKIHGKLFLGAPHFEKIWIKEIFIGMPEDKNS